MSWVIVRKGSEAYLAGVTVVLRLLALAAMMLMPFGMGLSPVAAAPMAHSAAGANSEGHCDPPAGSAKGKPVMGMHCSAACTALPAEVPDVGGWATVPAASPIAQAIEIFSGMIPPPATPPPKLG